VDALGRPAEDGVNRGVELRAEAVGHRFALTPTPVLQDISFHIDRGEIVSIVGASGSGKTTFLRVLAGLVQPTTGSVRLGETNVTGVADMTRAMVFQSDRLFPWRTAIQNVTFGLEVRGTKRSVARGRAQDALQLVGLGHAGQAYPGELSGGMRQRVNVARALVVDPEFLLMDEPFAALDAQTREIMQAELLRILGETSVGVVFVTHQIEEALYLSDRVVVFGANPGHIRDEVLVPFDRPRPLGIKREARFQDLYDHIWREIEADVLAGVASEQQSAAPAAR
jgi:NitT/TauT family transport system ATP-binding protein